MVIAILMESDMKLSDDLLEEIIDKVLLEFSNRFSLQGCHLVGIL